MRYPIFLFCLVLIYQCASPTEEPSTSSNAELTKPNIIYILADDLGYGDVSANNLQSKIKTTHLDQLAAEGIRLTDAHSPSSVCTPTRYGILMGRYC